MANPTNEKGTPVVEQTLNNQEAFFLKYKKAIIGVVVAVIVIIAGSIAYNNFYAGPREDKAATAVAKAQELFAQQQYELALKGDKTFEGFLQVAANYSGTDAANLANLYAGLCYAKMEKWQDAVKYLDQFSTQDDALISPAAMAALGNAYAHTKQIDKAISCLKKAADMANSEAKDNISISIAPTCLMQAARLLESQQKNDEALAIYQEVKTKYVKSPYRSEIDKYIERLKK